MVDTEDRVLTEHEVTRIWTLACSLAKPGRAPDETAFAMAARCYFGFMRSLPSGVTFADRPEDRERDVLRRRSDGAIERVALPYAPDEDGAS